MPTYEFACKCGFTCEKLVSIHYPKKSKCPRCQTDTLIRLIGTGSGFKIEGEGVYKSGWSITKKDKK